MKTGRPEDIYKEVQTKEIVEVMEVVGGSGSRELDGYLNARTDG